MQPSRDIENKRNTLNTALISVLWASVAIFILFILSTMILPLILSTLSIPPTIPVINFFPILGGIFFLLGIAIIVLTIKAKLKGLIKKFLLLAGASITGILVFALLHNLVYGLFIYFFGANFWDRIGGDEPFFFILATIVCPIGFLVGAIGSIVLLSKRKRLIRGN
ncbi:MAG: hypothetical protein M1371_09675 [Actinobacteria bacterium]|nr:hypothetical protein [Actinomycetota bacterium]